MYSKRALVPVFVILLKVCNALQSGNRSESTTIPTTSNSPLPRQQDPVIQTASSPEHRGLTTAAPHAEPQHNTGRPISPSQQEGGVPQNFEAIPPRLKAMVDAIHASQNEYGHVEVRKGAFLFWWLYFADGTKDGSHTKPLVIWIQGGPSIPGSGLGNFLEIGPLTLTLKKRPYSWVNGKNLLLIDSPVGTGYSYTQGDDLYCKTDKDVAADLIQLMKALLEKFPDFKTTPAHIFSQSYGTKIASYFAYYLDQDIKKGDLQMNLKTVALGGSWINTKITSLATSEYLFQTGFLDKPEYVHFSSMINNLTDMVDRKEYREAYKCRLEIANELYSQRSYDSYNVFQPRKDKKLSQLTSLMNGLVSFALGPPCSRTTWSFMNEDVFDALRPEFMKPAHHIVENILAETDLRVVVYNGDFDSVTPMAGAVNWVHELDWSGHDKFWNAQRKPLNGQGNGFFKEFEKLSLWWILKAGHWVPTDNPEAMDQLLEYIVHEKRDLFTWKTSNVSEKPSETKHTVPTTTQNLLDRAHDNKQ